MRERSLSLTIDEEIERLASTSVDQVMERMERVLSELGSGSLETADRVVRGLKRDLETFRPYRGMPLLEALWKLTAKTPKP